MKLPLTPSLANFSRKKNLEESAAVGCSALLIALSELGPVVDEYDED